MKLEDEIKTKFKSEEHKLALNIIFTANWLIGLTEVILKPYDLSYQQFNVLRILKGQEKKKTNLLDISKRMLDKMSNTTRLVEKLRTKGLVTREICSENRRKVEIEITREGLSILSALEADLSKINTDLFKNLSPVQMAQINEALDALRG